jgi:hypothetical protein
LIAPIDAQAKYATFPIGSVVMTRDVSTDRLLLHIATEKVVRRGRDYCDRTSAERLSLKRVETVVNYMISQG